MKRILTVTFVSWMGGSAALAQQSPQTVTPQGNVALSADAAVFVMKVTEGGAHEREAGRLAVSKASAADVKAFARRMVDHHTKVAVELATLARTKKITTSQNPDRVKAALAPLEGLTGAAFDRAYMEGRVRDHEATIALFDTQIATGLDADVRTWAQKTLPALREHLAMAKKVQAGLPAPQP